MSLFLYKHPFENSLFDVFDDDFFNYPLSKKHHFNFGCGHPSRIHCHRKNTLEKQLSRAFNNHEIFDIVDFTPKINLGEDEKHYYLHADLPGMTKDQVKMELNDDRILTISGERESIYDSAKDKDDDDKMETDNSNISKNENENENEVDKNNEDKEENKEELNKDKENTETKTTKEANNKKENENNEKEIRYNMVECSYGKFSRSFRIPEDANLENIQAKIENGVLEVIFNKIEPPTQQNRTIQIQ